MKMREIKRRRRKAAGDERVLRRRTRVPSLLNVDSYDE